jgi:predicted AAA+ superfamily ATPase
MLPSVVGSPSEAADLLDAYVNIYLKEEIKEEGLVRSLPPFLRFLQIAGMMNGQVVNALNISREAAVPRATVDTYFSILEETLLGHFLAPYRSGLKAREKAHKKFYWFDAGVARAAAGLLRDPADRSWLGFSLETLIYHELRTYNQASGRNRPIWFYPLSDTEEVDFLIETQKGRPGSRAKVLCIEVKLSEKWDRGWEKPMRHLAANPKIKTEKCIGIYMGSKAYAFDGVDVFPLAEFLALLHKGGVF